MNLQHSCPLCLSTANFFWQSDKKENYYACKTCEGIFLSPQNRLSKAKEFERYQLHENDVNDPDYQNFVNPIIQAVQKDFSTNTIGLDFGCGSGPVAAKMLRDKNYQVNLYDPFFYKKPESLKKQYDFIVCCEVMEHFYHPKTEFEKLYSLLKPKGKLYCKTSLMSEEIVNNFGEWFYKDDPTHVFLYTPKTLEIIQKNYRFSSFQIAKDFIVFQK